MKVFNFSLNLFISFEKYLNCVRLYLVDFGYFSKVNHGTDESCALTLFVRRKPRPAASVLYIYIGVTTSWKVLVAKVSSYQARNYGCKWNSNRWLSSILDCGRDASITFPCFITTCTRQKMKFSIKDFFSKYNQIHSFLQIRSHLLKKFLMENFIFVQ